MGWRRRYNPCTSAGVTQLAECGLSKPDVEGSTPFARSFPRGCITRRARGDRVGFSGRRSRAAQAPAMLAAAIAAACLSAADRSSASPFFYIALTGTDLTAGDNDYEGVNPSVIATGQLTVASVGGGPATSIAMRWNGTASGNLKVNGNSSFQATITTESTADPLIGYQLLTMVSSANAGTWNVNASGNWSTAGNWSGAIPSGSGASASFGSVIQAARTVTLDSARTVSSISFNSTNGYTLSGSALTLAGAAPSVSVTVGNHAISRRAELDASGGKEYIGYLLDAVPTAANVEYHAKIVREKAL